MVHCKVISLPAFGGAQGQLNAIEGGRDIPFDIQRVYYITGVPEGVTRGFHSHHHLEQVLICLNGSVKLRIKTPFEEEIVVLDNPTKGLYVGHMIWREMFEFTPGAVLMVLASEHYSEDDYLRDYTLYAAEAISYFQDKENEP